MKKIFYLLFALTLCACGTDLKEVPDYQRARYEAVKDEVDERALRMARENLGLPEGTYTRGMCHVVWKYKKFILKKEHDIDWHSPAEVHPGVIYD